MNVFQKMEESQPGMRSCGQTETGQGGLLQAAEYLCNLSCSSTLRRFGYHTIVKVDVSFNRDKDCGSMQLAWNMLCCLKQESWKERIREYTKTLTLFG